MLWPSKLDLSWDTDWARFDSLYSAAAGLGGKSKVPRSHAVLESKEKGRHGGYVIHAHMSTGELKTARDKQRRTPLAVGFANDNRLWWYQGKYYEADQDLQAHDIAALLHEAENKKRLKLEKAHALMAMRQQLDSKAKRQPILQDVKVAVWQRDAGRCVDCGSQKDLEYDHIIPLAMGGSNTERNLQLLCALCNRRKGATLG